MTEQPGLTQEQAQLVEATESIYVEACPGAGKTRAVVERFRKRPAPDPRRGVALLSFTNAVIDAALRRTADRPELHRNPNFVGTIDAFLNQFVVGPIWRHEHAKLPSFTSSWRLVGNTQVTAPTVPLRAQLDWFRFTLAGEATLEDKRAPVDQRWQIRNLESWKKTRLETAAAARWKALTSRGVLDATAARLHLARYLDDAAWTSWLRDLMGARFYEVIVDEVQDCSDEDVQLLELIRDAGVRLVLVGDPDQAIYAFRGASAQRLAALKGSIPNGDRLSGNFRSTAAICKVVDSIRSSDASDEAVGTNSATPHPVTIIPFDSYPQVRSRVAGVIASCQIKPVDVVVLAHSAAAARSAAGATAVKTTNRMLTNLARLVQTIRDEKSPPKARAEALTVFGEELRGLTSNELRDLPIADFFTSARTDARRFREQALRIASALPSPFAVDPGTFKSAFKSQLAARPAYGWQPGSLPVPTGNVWEVVSDNAADALPHSTVHSFKGLQQTAVALVIPKRAIGTDTTDDGLAQWSGVVAGEARNVLYVGASRAQDLLMIVAHTSTVDEVKANLDRDGAEYVVYAQTP